MDDGQNKPNRSIGRAVLCAPGMRQPDKRPVEAAIFVVLSGQNRSALPKAFAMAFDPRRP